MSKNKKNLLIIQSRIQHYRVPFFDSLKKKLEGDYNLLVTGGGKNNTSTGNIKRNYFHGIKFIKLGIIHLWIGLFPVIRKFDPDIIITTASPRNLSILILYIYCKLLDIRLIGWSKVYSDRSKHSSSNLKLSFYKLFKELIVYGQCSKTELLRMGYSGNIFIANNTINTDITSKNNLQKISLMSKKIINKYNLKNKKIILCIGRLDKVKNPNDLFYLEKIQKKIKDIVIIFVGDGPLLKNIKDEIKKRNLYNYLVIGQVPILEDYAWIKIANLVLLPGQVGLAMKQAMILKSMCLIADEEGPDTEALIDGVSGYRFEKGNKLKMNDKAVIALKNNKKNSLIIENAFEEIKNNHSIKSMINNFEKIILR